jgi:hypothetical protein
MSNAKPSSSLDPKVQDAPAVDMLLLQPCSVDATSSVDPVRVRLDGAAPVRSGRELVRPRARPSIVPGCLCI